MIWDYDDSIAAIGDTHFPFSNRKSINMSLEIIGALKPKLVIQVGDLYDLFSATRFPRRIFITPKEEYQRGRADAELFWDLVRKASPNSKRVQLRGNHDIRAHKQVIENVPGIDSLAVLDSIWDFSEYGVETIYDPRDVFEYNGILFTHGHRSKLGQHMEEMEFKNTVCGHSHTGGVHYRRLSSGRIAWELNCGYNADPFNEALLYRPLIRYFKWTWGIGLIDFLGPRFVPFG